MEASSELELHPGDEYRLILGGPGSTGYVWEYTVDALPGVISVVEIPSRPPADESRGLRTFSVEHSYVIRATGPGTAVVQFVLKRPWETAASPLRVKIIRVTVVQPEARR